MNSELNDLLFEIEDSFDRLNSRIKFIKNIKTQDINYIFDWFEYLKLDCNDLNFYTRALSDKLSEEKE